MAAAPGSRQMPMNIDGSQHNALALAMTMASLAPHPHGSRAGQPADADDIDGSQQKRAGACHE